VFSSAGFAMAACWGKSGGVSMDPVTNDPELKWPDPMSTNGEHVDGGDVPRAALGNRIFPRME